MSFAEGAKESGAEPVYVVNVEVRQCFLLYGFNDCQAELGVTGDDRCFNTRATCQDPANFSPLTKGYTFIEALSDLPQIDNLPVDSIGIFPFLSGPPRFSASELDPGGGFGIRAACNFSLEDSAHHDMNVDPYWNQRDYDPFEVGTFFGKWLARHPFYIGSRVWVSLGHIVDGRLDLSDAQTLVYFVESIDGPDSGGSVKVKCKDVLKLADNTRAQCPEPSEGVLIANLEEGETTFFVGPPEAVFTYPEDVFKVRIGDEILRCTRNGEEFTVVGQDGSVSPNGRGIDKTQQDDHETDSTVQLVKEFAPSTVPEILTELLTEFATIDPSFIDDQQWTDAQQDIGFLFGAQISEPEGIKDLAEQLLRASGAFIYYDERSQLLKLGSIVPTPDISELPLINDDQTFIEDSVRLTRKDDMRLSQVWYYRGLIDSTDDLDDPVNYENRLISADIEAETGELYGQKQIDKVWARWTPRLNAAAAFVVAGRRLNRFRRTPRMATFSADTKDAGLWQGDLVALEHRNLQSASGAIVPTPFQILRVSHSGRAVVNYTALEYDVDPVGDYDGLDTLIIDQDVTQINLLMLYELTIGPVENAGPVITVIVLAGVRVREMAGGGFPDSKIRLINRGFIAGLGGEGGRGGIAISDGETVQGGDGFDGGDGGDAITMSEDWDLFNYGSIYAGAGAGGGGGGGATSTDFACGAGGGGAQDLLTADGGLSGCLANGNDGEDGDQDGPGLGGDTNVQGTARGGEGGDGGEWGQPGTAGDNASGSNESFGLGGAAGAGGKAIIKNGFTLDVQEEGEIIGTVEP